MPEVVTPPYDEYMPTLRGMLEEAHNMGDDALFQQLLDTAGTDVTNFSTDFQAQFYQDIEELSSQPRAGIEYSTTPVQHPPLPKDTLTPEEIYMLQSQRVYTQINQMPTENAKGRNAKAKAIRHFTTDALHGDITPEAIRFATTRFSMWSLRDTHQAQHSEESLSRASLQELQSFAHREWERFSPAALKQLLETFANHNFHTAAAGEILRGYFKGPKTKAQTLECMTRFAYAMIDSFDNPDAMKTAAYIGSFLPTHVPGGLTDEDILPVNSPIAHNMVVMQYNPCIEFGETVTPQTIAKRRKQAERDFMRAINLDDIFLHSLQIFHPGSKGVLMKRLDQYAETDPTFKERFRADLKQSQEIFGPDYIRVSNAALNSISNRTPNAWAKENLLSVRDPLRIYFNRVIEAEIYWKKQETEIMKSQEEIGRMVQISLPHDGLKMSVFIPHFLPPSSQRHIFDTIFTQYAPASLSTALEAEAENNVYTLNFDSREIDYHGVVIKFWPRLIPRSEADMPEIFALEQVGFPEAALPEGQMLQEATDTLAAQVAEDQRVFLTKKPIRVPFDAYPELTAFGYSHVDFRKDPQNKKQIQAQMYFSGYEHPFTMTFNENFGFDLQGKAQDNRTFTDSIRIQLLRLLKKIICKDPRTSGTKEDTENEINLLKVLARHPHLRTLPFPEYHYSTTARDAYKRDEGKDLEDEDKKNRTIDPQGRGKTYVQAKFTDPDDVTAHVVNLPGVMQFAG